MAHKTLIGGTAYEISGGRTLVGGTGYDIDKGKTLVGGTVYEVGFAKLTNGTLYLRPSADVFFTGDRYPAELEYGYLAMSEEVSDEFATYIGGSGQGVGGASYKVEGTFAISLGTSATVNIVFGGGLFIKYALQGRNSVNVSNIENQTNIDVTVTVNGVTYSLLSRVVHSDKEETVYTDNVTIPAEMINSINKYIATNGAIPEITIDLLARAWQNTDTTDKKTAVAKIDHIYLALECEYIG